MTGQNLQVKDQPFESDIGCARLHPFGTIAHTYKLQNNSQKDGVPVFDLGQWAAFQTSNVTGIVPLVCFVK